MNPLSIINFFRLSWWRLTRPTTVGVKCIVSNPGGRQILLLRTKYGADWVLPGGGCKRRETPIDACLREVREETGIRLDKKHLALKGIYLSEREYKRDIVFLFGAELPMWPAIKPGLEISQVRYVELEEAKQIASPATRRRLEELQGYRVSTFEW